jgi:hypothetical protein
VQWWRGDWWAYGADRKYGDGREIAEKAGVNYETAKQYGSVARAFELCERSHNLTFDHHLRVMAAPEGERQYWLQKALEGDGDGKPWSSNQLRAAIKQGAAFQRTRKVELEAAALGKFAAQRRKTDVLRSLFRRAYHYRNRNTQLAAGRIELNQFHVTVHVTDKNTARRATEAILHRVPISIRGTVGDKLGFFKGVARSVDEDENATPKRWRVTILEEDA